MQVIGTSFHGPFRRDSMRRGGGGDGDVACRRRRRRARRNCSGDRRRSRGCGSGLVALVRKLRHGPLSSCSGTHQPMGKCRGGRVRSVRFRDGRCVVKPPEQGCMRHRAMQCRSAQQEESGAGFRFRGWRFCGECRSGGVVSGRQQNTTVRPVRLGGGGDKRKVWNNDQAR